MKDTAACLFMYSHHLQKDIAVITDYFLLFEAHNITRMAFFRNSKFENISPISQWHPVNVNIGLKKILLMVYEALNGLAPHYLSDLT